MGLLRERRPSSAVRVGALAGLLVGCGCPGVDPSPFPGGATMVVRWGEAVEGTPFTRCTGLPPTPGRADPCADGAIWNGAVYDGPERGVLSIRTPFLFNAYVYELRIEGDIARLCRQLSPSDLYRPCPESDVRCSVAGEVQIDVDLIAIHAELAGGVTLDAVVPRTSSDAGTPGG